MIPARSTLSLYGMGKADFVRLLMDQSGSCPVCGRAPDRYVIDHEHVKGWKKMKPADRRRYVRGLLCNRCNWQFLRRGMTARIAANLAAYLSSYENRKNVT